MDIFNRMNQEIENVSKEKLSKLSEEEISQRAKKYRKTWTIIWSTFGIISALAFIILFSCMPLMLDGESIPAGVMALLIIMALCITGAPFVDLFLIFQKSDKELALKAMRKEIKSSVYNNVKYEQQKKELPDTDFIISKTIPILASGWSSTKLLIDNQNKKFIYQKGKIYSNTYKFSDIINYEVYENGKSQVQGRAGSALIGGAFFGLGGLIVGSSMSRKINEKCNQLKLIIRLNDFNCPQIVITYVDNVDWDKNGWTYRNMKENLQSVCSMLEFMLNEKSLEQSSTVKQEESHAKKSYKEQLQELKEMLDDGLITQEDFEQKKKQILGL